MSLKPSYPVSQLNFDKSQTESLLSVAFSGKYSFLLLHSDFVFFFTSVGTGMRGLSAILDFSLHLIAKETNFEARF